MTDPIKTIVDETLAAAEKATPVVRWYLHEEEVRGPYSRWIKAYGPVRRKTSLTRGVVLHASIQEDLAYVAASMNNAEKLALIVRELSDRLTKIREELGPKEEYVETVAEIRETFERARAIAAGKGDGG